MNDLHANALMVNWLKDDLAEHGACVLVLGKRHVDTRNPLYSLVRDLVPECRIICELDI